MIEVDASIYKKILAVLLIFAILKMLNVFGKENNTIKDVKLWQGFIVGGIIGFFSGLIGIGGGIIINTNNFIITLGKNERSSSCFRFIYLGEFGSRINRPSIPVALTFHRNPLFWSV